MKHLFIIGLLFSATLHAQIVHHRVKPSDTDPLITTFNTDSNYTYVNPTVSSKNLLVVHLPGTFGEPKRATLFGQHAANLGFHSIGLMYTNAPTVASFCSSSTDSFCHEKVRKEIIEGIDYSPEISINANECVLNRIKKLLLYLKTNFPSENWGQYLDASNELIFSKIIVSGHSQGGGHALMIAKNFPVARCLCFSSPKDYIDTLNIPSPWIFNGTWTSPMHIVYSFTHTGDNYADQAQILDSLGLNAYGAPVITESTSIPYSYTRQLITSYPVPSGDEHASTIQDNKTPKLSGVPVFLDVWTYMLTNTETTAVNENNSTAFNMIVYPNPVTNLCTIHLPEANGSLTIFSSNGNRIAEWPVQANTLAFNTTDLPQGCYFLRYTNSMGTMIAKFIKQ